MRHRELIELAIDKNASDVHIAPYAKPMLRINGQLVPFSDSPVLTNDEVYQDVKQLCTQEQLSHLEEFGEVNFSFSIAEHGRFRVNIIKQRGTYSISVRLFKRNIPSWDSLGLPESLFDLVALKRGLILISGVSSSGRSTTIAALIQYLNERKALNIVTVESPIEYLFKHGESLVLQRDVGTDCPSLIEGIKSAMVHDPDVVMISNVNDDASLELALQIAESGKLVLAGYSSLNSISTIESIIASAGVERADNRKLKLASNLIAILSQQLVPGISETNRVLVYEMLLSNATTRSQIQQKLFDELRNTLNSGKKQGMMSMDMHLFERYQAGDISKETLHQYCQDIEFVKRLAK